LQKTRRVFKAPRATRHKLEKRLDLYRRGGGGLGGHRFFVVIRRERVKRKRRKRDLLVPRGFKKKNRGPANAANKWGMGVSPQAKDTGGVVRRARKVLKKKKNRGSPSLGQKKMGATPVKNTKEVWERHRPTEENRAFE